jgi:hypothetical protein
MKILCLYIEKLWPDILVIIPQTTGPKPVSRAEAEAQWGHPLPFPPYAQAEFPPPLEAN